eukprot:3643439-Prorocentrum_lima.AAC.1
MSHRKFRAFCVAAKLMRTPRTSHQFDADFAGVSSGDCDVIFHKAIQAPGRSWAGAVFAGWEAYYRDF